MSVCPELASDREKQPVSNDHARKEANQ